MDRNRLQAIISTNADLEDEMQSEIAALAADPSSFEEKFTKQKLSALEEGINEAKTGLGKMAEKWEVPANATAEQKALIEKHNERYEKVKGVVEEVASSILNNPRMQGRAALIMGQAIYLSEVNQELMASNESKDKTISKLSTELDAIKRSGSITPSLNVLPASQVAEQTVKTLPDANTAVRGLLSEIE